MRPADHCSMAIDAADHRKALEASETRRLSGSLPKGGGARKPLVHLRLMGG